MTDDVHPGVLDGLDYRLSVFFPASSLEAADVYAGYPQIHPFIVRRIEVHPAFEVQNVQFCAKKQVHAVHFPRDCYHIVEINRIAGPGNRRTVLGYSKISQIQLRCPLGHFLKAAVCVAGCDCMCMQIQFNLSHVISRFLLQIYIRIDYICRL